MRFHEVEGGGHRVLRPHAVVIALEVGDIFYLATVSFKVSLCVAHRDQLVVYGVQEKAWDISLRSLLNRIESVQIESVGRLVHSLTDLWPHHLHQRFRRHARHYLGNHALGYLFENAERAVNDHAGNRDRRVGIIVAQGCGASHAATPKRHL